MDVPALDGIHHVKVPVTDLHRSRDWYTSRLGYVVDIVFVENGREMGVVLSHPRGGPDIGLRLAPERSDAVGDFDFFSVGVPDKDAMDALAERLTALGESHAGVHFATIGWILPALHDPDGHEVRFYTTARHSDMPHGQAIRVENPRETAEAHEREAHEREAHEREAHEREAREREMQDASAP